MGNSMITTATIRAFLSTLDEAFGGEGQVYLIGETSQVYEGWRSWTTLMELCADLPAKHEKRFERAAFEIARARQIRLSIESPAELIPLPAGFEQRAIPVAVENTPGTRLSFFHFDPFSVAFRFIARGDEPDYHLVLMMMENGWITMEALDAALEALLPDFTSETIQQDPAEFRRKYKGLKQMWKAHRPGQTHRFSEA